MIIFPQDAKYEYTNERRVEKECKNNLEETLRKLGNFKKGAINITEYEQGKEYYDVIYKVKDLDNTVFTFLNFGLGKSTDSVNRFRQNYQLTMKREKSEFLYKYDFKKVNYSNCKQGLRMIEVSYPSIGNRIIRLERKLHQSIRIIVEEKSKKYVLVIHNYNDERDIEVLEDFENIVRKAMNIENLNLESILTIIKNQNQLNSAYIFKEEKLLVSISFRNCNITDYEIYEPSRTIMVTIGNNITREVTREINGKKINLKEEITDSNIEKLQSDCKRLFKQL